MNYKYNIALLIALLLLNCYNKMKILNNQKYNLVWEENFDHTLNLSFWNIEIKEPGWVNNELQAYTSDKKNLFIKDSKLHINAIKEKDNYYTSGRLTTQQKINWQYGYFEIKAKFDSKKGTWPAIWLLSETIHEDGWPKCGEIDIMEHVNNEKQIHGSLHSDEYNHMKGNNLGNSYSIGNKIEDFNIYGLEWTKDKISWYVNDVLFYSINKKDYFKENWPYDNKYFMILNLAIGGNWPGNPSENFQSSLFIIDWIKVYQ